MQDQELASIVKTSDDQRPLHKLPKNPQLNPQASQSTILSSRSLRQLAALTIEHNYSTVWIEVKLFYTNDKTPVEQIVLNHRTVSTRTTNPPLPKPVKLALGYAIKRVK